MPKRESEHGAHACSIGRLLGKSLGYRINEKAATADERTAAKAELPAVGAERDALERQMNDRRRAILAADQEYQALVIAYKDAKTRADKLASTLHSYKFTVGVSNGMFFHVKAEGDSWEEVINQVSNRTK